MIQEEEILFITTTLYTKWLGYQSNLIKKLFPNSKHLIVDGRGGWPNSWFYWIDRVKNSKQKYYIHLDEDFFITSKEEIMKVIQRMEDENIGLMGCSDGYHHYRGANPVALNTFIMFGRIEDLKKIDIDLAKGNYQLGTYDNKSYSYFNNLGLKYETDFSKDFIYPHKIQGGCNFTVEQEPYYAFLWSMKKIGVKFGYLYPHFDEYYKSTNPRIDEESKDIGIHMWYTRQWNNSMDVHGLPNIERYQRIEKYLTGNA